MLVDFVVAKFQSKQSNPNGAQLIFTTHNTELMNMEILRKDQLYFADKSSEDGTSELYSISEFGTRTTDNIRKGYLLGKYGATPDIARAVLPNGIKTSIAVTASEDEWNHIYELRLDKAAHKDMRYTMTLIQHELKGEIL